MKPLIPCNEVFQTLNTDEFHQEKFMDNNQETTWREHIVAKLQRSTENFRKVYLVRSGADAARRQRGMTLIEIMVVLAIIGMIMGGLVFAYMNWFKQSQEDVARSQVQRVGAALMNYYMHNQEFPSNIDELATGKNAPLKSSQLRDPWNEPWSYSDTAQRGQGDFDLCSKGPDKREGTDDDICLE
tara:strand:+ start:857 stop:1411 length:555 start_codon:yes stop_codon:yes gene_type:complete